MSAATGGTFVEVSTERLVAMLQECGAGVVSVGGTFAEERVGRERVFVLASPGKAVVRVYSSLGVGQSEARDCGKDAVRISVGVVMPEGWRSVTAPKRIFRTAPRRAEDREGVFLGRLRQALRDAWKVAMTVPRCPSCGTLMAQRTAKGGGAPFWGCLNYPKCTGTRKVA